MWAGRLGVLAAVVGAVVFAGWIGTEAVKGRFATLLTVEAFDSRVPMWRDGLALVPETWPTGTGAGSFQWVEITVRRLGGSRTYYDSAHNEYLEALVEGGVVRLGFTLLVAVGPLVVLARGAARLRDDPAGPLLLGAWYGLAALALHCTGDFGIRIPAVAMLAAAVAGMAMGVPTEPIRERPRTRVRVRVRVRTPVPPQAVAESTLAVESRESRWVVRGPAAGVVGGCVVLVALAAAAESRGRAVDSTLQEGSAILAARGSRASIRVQYEAARVAARPDDTLALTDLAVARFAAAAEMTAGLGQTVAGPAAFFVRVDDFPAVVRAKYADDGLRAARAARDACPLNPRAHHLLGVYAAGFTRTEPPAVHFERAKRLLAVDPYIWYRAGLDAYNRGDLPAAWANWRESLARAPDELRPILRKSGAKLTPAEVLDRVLPDDPAVLVRAADELFPKGSTARRPYLERAATGGVNPTGPGLAAAARAADELGDATRTATAWRRAVAEFPSDAGVRAGCGEWFERTERYADALPHLEWLAVRRPGDASLTDRLRAARRGAELDAELGLGGR